MSATQLAQLGWHARPLNTAGMHAFLTRLMTRSDEMLCAGHSIML